MSHHSVPLQLAMRFGRLQISKQQRCMQVRDAMAGDLEAPGQLAALAAARSHNKEIIVIASNAAGARLAFNLVLSLQAQGIAHYIWLTDDPTYCKALYFGPLRVACAWSSYLSVRPSHARQDLLSDIVCLCFCVFWARGLLQIDHFVQ